MHIEHVAVMVVVIVRKRV